MPELPEVETTRRGIEPHIRHQRISSVIVRHSQLRWPVDAHLERHIANQTIQHVFRRSKYLILALDQGSILIHLGMSGSLRVLKNDVAPKKHDHIDLKLANGYCLRYHDPRRFGAWLFTQDPVADHKLLRHLGPEPLSRDFDHHYLFSISRNRTTKIKQLLMNAKIVVGVGNIYANEVLFLSGIHPHTRAGDITKTQSKQLTAHIKQTLKNAIKRGGTTLRDFVGGDGKPGYFAQSLTVYGRKGLPCVTCNTPIEEIRTQNRSTCFCPQCQIL